MRCDEVRPLISAGLDGELEPAAAARLQVHLAGCALCAAEQESLSATVRLLRAVPEADPPAELRRRIGVALLEAERHSERRWFGLSWLARPQAAGWAWGAALGTVAATLGLLAIRGPVPARTVAGALSPPSQAHAPAATATPVIRKGDGHKSGVVWEKKPAPRVAVAPMAPAPLPAPEAVPASPISARTATGAGKATVQPVLHPSPEPTQRLKLARRPAPVAPSSRPVPSASPRLAPGSGPHDAASREMPLVVRSEQAPLPSPPPSDPPAPEYRPDTDGMMQMASGMPETPSPSVASDDLVELRRQLLDRPLHVPELGALKPTSSSHASRDGWIRF